MSPGRMTVQGMMPLIFLPGPARPSTAPAKIRSRVTHCDRLRADSSVCGSSRTTSDGRTVCPSARLYFIPRMRPVMPATLMIAPEALLPGMVGRTTSLAVQPMCVRRPWWSWPEQRLAIPSRHRTGWTTSGKSASRRSLPSSSILIESSISTAWTSEAPMRQTNWRWP